jgi:RNA polymerase sigma-70 factor (ECF subfamily)
MAHRALSDGGVAEEAVQETFLRAWRAADRYDPGLSSLRTWLFAIARNVVVDLARARSSRPRPAELGPEHEGRPEAQDPIEGALRSWGIEEGLRRISGEHRQAIVDTYYRGRSCAEVAAEAGIPEGTVRSRLFYGLKSLRLALEERGWTE